MKQKKVLGGLFGLAVGDALGVPVEFYSREILDKNPVTDMIEYGTHNQPLGTWSDDTSLTCCLAESLCNRYDLKDIMDKFQQWYYAGYWTPHGQIFDVGKATSIAITNMSEGKIRSGGSEEEDNGNGSLMRILPVAFLTYDIMDSDVIYRIVKEISSLTHAHMRSVIACTIYIFLSNNIINGHSKEQAYNLMNRDVRSVLDIIRNKEFDHYKRILKNISDLERDEISSSTYVVDTLEAAIWCFMNCKNYEDTVLTAVNLGGDTDTVAAIAGGLAGLYYGFESIPSKWVNNLARGSDLTNLSIRLSKSLTKRHSEIPHELLPKIKYKETIPAEIKDSYHKLVNDETKVIEIMHFCGRVVGYPVMEKAVTIAAQVNGAVHRYYSEEKAFAIFTFKEVATALFFICRARRYMEDHSEYTEYEVALTKEIVRRVKSL